MVLLLAHGKALQHSVLCEPTFGAARLTLVLVAVCFKLAYALSACWWVLADGSRLSWPLECSCSCWLTSSSPESPW